MTSLERNLLVTVAVLSASAVAFSAFGGVASVEGPGRPLMAAGAGFCLLMLLVPLQFGASLNWPRWTGPVAAGGCGALVGVCGSLYIGAGVSLTDKVGLVVGGIVMGLVAYGRYWFRRRM